MGNAARKQRKASGVKFVKEPKTPTRKYITREDREVRRLRDKATRERAERAAAKLNAAFLKGQQRAVTFKESDQ